MYIYSDVMKTIQCAHPHHHSLELRHWLSIADMLPQSHCGDEEDGRIGLSS